MNGVNRNRFGGKQNDTAVTLENGVAVEDGDNAAVEVSEAKIGK